jgi:ribosomal protein S18 acetylase RimI-like enzyme
MHVIREYRPEDAPQVEACFGELQDSLHRLEPQVLESKAAKHYFDFMFARCAETHGKIFVAEVEHQVVGFIALWATVQSEELDEEPSEYAFISDLVVLPAYRGHGLGRMLLQKAEAYARHQGATTLKLEVLHKNQGAIGLYTRQGFSPYQVLMVKHLHT